MRPLIYTGPQSLAILTAAGLTEHSLEVVDDRQPPPDSRAAEAIKRGRRIDTTKYLKPSYSNGYYESADGSIRKAVALTTTEPKLHNKSRRRRAAKAGRR